MPEPVRRDENAELSRYAMSDHRDDDEAIRQAYGDGQRK